MKSHKRIAMYLKEVLLYSAFWLQRRWATYKIKQETAYFKGGLFENKIVISKSPFYFKRMLLFKRTS